MMARSSSPELAPFRLQVARAWEAIAFAAALCSVTALLLAVVGGAATTGGRAPVGALSRSLGSAAFAGVLALGCVAVCNLVLARRWSAEWLVYGAEAALVGASLLGRSAFGAPHQLDAFVIVALSYVDFGISQALEQHRLPLYARPTFYGSLAMPVLSLALALWRGQWDEASLILLFSGASFYGVICQQKRWKAPGYVAAVLYTVFLWLAWERIGWRFTDYPQLYLVPIGLLAILFAEVNRSEIGRQNLQILRGLGATVIYVSTALPVWQFQSFVAWLMLLLFSLAGILTGIGMRVQSFLWLGLVCFLLDLVYPLGRLGMENALARWGIMLALGILLVLFAALAEKRQIVAAVRACYEQVRQWE